MTVTASCPMVLSMETLGEFWRRSEICSTSSSSLPLFAPEAGDKARFRLREPLCLSASYWHRCKPYLFKRTEGSFRQG